MEEINLYYQHETAKGFHDLLLNVALYMKKFYFVHLHKVKNDTPIKIGEIITYVYDCELLIHFTKSDVCKGISFADTETLLNNLFFLRNNPKDVFLLAHSGSKSIINRNFDFTFIKTIYVPENPRENLDHYYIRRSLLTDFKDKFVFRGNVHPMNRGTAVLLKDNEYFEGYDYIDKYFYNIIECKVGLALPGIAEFCHRDVEYMGIGLPIMKFQYISDSNPPLIPNFHYISIDRIDNNIQSERVGGEEYKNAYIKRFLEVKDDFDFLTYISENARKYYENYLHPLKMLDNIILNLINNGN